IMTLVYHGQRTSVFLSTGSSHELRGHLFDAYIKKMLTRRNPKSLYKEPETKYWLSWLSNTLRQGGLTELYLERMQPSWLSTNTHRYLYTIGIGLVTGLLFGLSTIAIETLGFSFLEALRDGLSVGLVFGLVFGLTGGKRRTKSLYKQYIRQRVRNIASGGLIG